jgi:hypothetical protein
VCFKWIKINLVIQKESDTSIIDKLKEEFEAEKLTLLESKRLEIQSMKESCDLNELKLKEKLGSLGTFT